MTKQYCALVVDRSGSMAGKEQDTIGGINTCVQELKNQKEAGDEIFITLKWFDHEQIVYMDKVAIDEYNPLNISDFKPRGQTALLDAMGDTINNFITMKQLDTNAFDSCMIYVATDGLENCSRKYTKTGMKTLIQSAKDNYDIMVIYMAANQDAILEAGSMGINQNNAINYDENENSTRAVYTSAARVAHRVRSGQSSSFLGAERQASQPIPPSRQMANTPTRSASSVPNRNTQPPTIDRQTGMSNVQPQPHVQGMTHVRATRFSNNPSPSTPTSFSSIPEWKQHIFLDAAKDNNWQTVYGLLNETPELINVVGGSANRWTALHQACGANDKDVVSYLLSKGANKNIVNRDGLTASQVCTSHEIKEIIDNQILPPPPPSPVLNSSSS